MDAKRLEATTTDKLSAWFDGLNSIMQSLNIKSENIYNYNKTGIALRACIDLRQLDLSITTFALLKSPEDRKWVLILETISSSGAKRRPFIIFKGQSLQTTWFRANNVPDWLYTTSPSGWTSNDIAIHWLDTCFLPETSTGSGTRLLLLDGHGSHVTVEFMKKCFYNNVWLYYLIPHSSHVLQPLDLTCFAPIKSRYRRQIADLASLDDAAPIKKIRFI